MFVKLQTKRDAHAFAGVLKNTLDKQAEKLALIKVEPDAVERSAKLVRFYEHLSGLIVMLGRRDIASSPRGKKDYQNFFVAARTMMLDAKACSELSAAASDTLPPQAQSVVDGNLDRLKQQGKPASPFKR